mgnify:CR=1 FL=1
MRMGTGSEEIWTNIEGNKTLRVCTVFLYLNAWLKNFFIFQTPHYAFDSYSIIALGNIWLQALYIPTKDKDREKVLQDRALSMYSKVLKSDPSNIWAANGVGVYELDRAPFILVMWNVLIFIYCVSQVVCWRIKDVWMRDGIYSLRFVKQPLNFVTFGWI